MTNSQPMPRDQESEALYWLEMAKRILAGTIAPHEAQSILRLGRLRLEACEAQDRQPILAAVGQTPR